jgi:hypothetical protein
MGNKLNNLTTQVGNAFAHLDAQEIKQETAYVIETADMIIDLFKTPTTNNLQKIELNKVYTKLINDRGIDIGLAGAIRFERRNQTLEEANAIIETIATKPLQAKHEKRNYRIAEKLLKKGVEEFDFNNQEVIWGGDFETTWRVEDFLVTLKVIFAGGYNIQRFHPRILVNVKKEVA